MWKRKKVSELMAAGVSGMALMVAKTNVGRGFPTPVGMLRVMERNGRLVYELDASSATKPNTP